MVEQLCAAVGQQGAGQIDAGQNGTGWTRGVQSLERGVEAFEIDAFALCQHHGGLRESGDVLVDARHEYVGTGGDGVRRKVGVEAEVGAPGCVDREWNAVRVCKFGVGGHVGDAADVARLDEHHRFGVRVLCQGFGDATDRHAGGQAGLFVDVRANPDRHQSGQHDAEKQRLVNGAGDDNLVARLAEAQTDRLVAV